MSTAVYHMERNTYLGDCLCVVNEPLEGLRTADHLQANTFFALIRSEVDLSNIKCVADIAQTELFIRERPILLRIGSECMFGIFGDSHCDCEQQRVASLREIKKAKQGIYLHLPQDAQGRGLLYKARELQLQVRGLTPEGQYVGPMSVSDASALLLGPDEKLDRRGYASVQEFIGQLRLDRYEYTLITDSPAKRDSLVGLHASDTVSPYREINLDNAGEFLAKVYQKNYRISNPELENIYHALASAEKFPARVLTLLDNLKEDLANNRNFDVDNELLQQIVALADDDGGFRPRLSGIELDGPRLEGYDETQVELKACRNDIDALFSNGIFKSITSLRYEENHFYDLASFEGVPSRSLKIRYAYRLQDLSKFDECKLVYKVPLEKEGTYRIHVSEVTDADLVLILTKALVDVERHVLPVLTHNVEHGGDPRCTVLIKRYAQDLKVLSVMGPTESYRELIDQMQELIEIEEIDDPSNARFIDRSLSLGFDRRTLMDEEVELYRRYSLG